MILHIVVDDKFIDSAWRSFEECAPGKNEFLLLSSAKRLKYVKKTPLRQVSPFKILSPSFRRSLKGYEGIFIHWMDPVKFLWLLILPKECRVAWIGWGADYNGLIYPDFSEMLMPRTFKIWCQLRNSISLSGVKNRFVSLVKRAMYSPLAASIALRRINVFAPVLPSEYELVRKRVKKFSAEFAAWNYGNLEDDLIRGFEGRTVSGTGVLVGNSATPENNHVEAFLYVAKMNGVDKVVCPLSYGNRKYADIVAKHGRDIFGDRFEELRNFMPVEEYIRILCSCPVVVMNHIRQQAVGNIVIMMHLGARVYLHPQSPVFDFLKKHGAVIFTTKELGSAKLEPLSQGEIDLNRAIVKKIWGKTSVIVKTQDLISVLVASDRKQRF